MHQTRADLRGEINTGGGFLDKIRFRSGFADYQHSEIEDTGEVGTTFYSKGIESRLELVQTKQDGWEGAIGAQMLMRDFRIVGEEKFLPKNETRQLSLFTLQSIRSEEHTSELQSLMRISYPVFCLKTKNNKKNNQPTL